MDDGQFQWDDIKAAANVAKHGITFDMARGVFSDPFAIEWLDNEQDTTEPRFVVLGMTEGRVLVVAYTMRGETIRIISARRAEAFERRRYANDDEA